MRLLYVNDALAIYGGIERVLVDKVNYLADEYGYEVHLVTVNQGSHRIPYPLSNKVQHKDLGILFHQQYKFKGFRRFLKRWQLNRLFAQRLRDYINSIRPDIIVSTRSGLVATIVSVKGKLPLIFESHNTRYTMRFNKADLFSRLKVERCNRHVNRAEMVVALTDGDAEDWRDINSHVCVIPNVVHLNDSGLYSSCTQKSVIFVGRFSPQKDIRSLLQIWSLVHLRYPDWQLQIYGGYGEEKEELLSEISSSYLDMNINVYEPTPDILSKYRENSILLLTSRFEPFGLVIPEAMSCGLPVVAFDCPYGPADIITDGVDGFLIENHDITGFVNSLCHLIENEGLRVEMGKQGIQNAKRYSAESVMPLWKCLFEKILS